MKRLVREPLLHFVLLGAALFAVYSGLNRAAVSSPDEIVVSAGQVANLTANFVKVWQRQPTAEELKGLIDSYVQEEVLSREAVKLGLDRHDPVIRRRLQQKMEFFAEDFAAMEEPSEQDLAEYLATHPEKFQQDARFTFRQVYLNPDQRGAALDTDAQQLLHRLQAGGAQVDVTQLGDRLLLPREFTREPWAAVSAQFGREFVHDLERVPTNEWAGPIESGYGRHLVYVSERTQARVPTLDEVRNRVERSYSTARREAANQRLIETLLERYTVILEVPQADAASETDPATTAVRP